VGTLRRSGGMHALLLLAEDGPAYLAWALDSEAMQDGGAQLLRWVRGWEEETGGAPGGEPPQRIDCPRS
jgi:hypothetical protein